MIIMRPEIIAQIIKFFEMFSREFQAIFKR